MDVLAVPILIEVGLVAGAILAFTYSGGKGLGWVLLALAVALPILGLVCLLVYGAGLAAMAG